MWVCFPEFGLMSDDISCNFSYETLSLFLAYRFLVCVKLCVKSQNVNNSFLVIWHLLTKKVLSTLLKPNDCWLSADGGVGNSDAVYREQEHHPAGPRLPDPPAGVVRLRLPALVSHPHAFICPNFLLHVLTRNVLISGSVQTFFFSFSAVKWCSSYVLDNFYFFIYHRPHTVKTANS